MWKQNVADYRNATHKTYYTFSTRFSHEKIYVYLLMCQNKFIGKPYACIE